MTGCCVVCDAMVLDPDSEAVLQPYAWVQGRLVCHPCVDTLAAIVQVQRQSRARERAKRAGLRVVR